MNCKRKPRQKSKKSCGRKWNIYKNCSETLETINKPQKNLTTSSYTRGITTKIPSKKLFVVTVWDYKNKQHPRTDVYRWDGLGFWFLWKGFVCDNFGCNCGLPLFKNEVPLMSQIYPVSGYIEIAKSRHKMICNHLISYSLDVCQKGYETSPYSIP